MQNTTKTQNDHEMTENHYKVMVLNRCGNTVDKDDFQSIQKSHNHSSDDETDAQRKKLHKTIPNSHKEISTGRKAHKPLVKR